MAKKGSLAPLVGAGLGAYIGWKLKKPLIGAGVGFAIGMVGAARKIQGPDEGMRMGWGRKQYPWEGFGNIPEGSQRATNMLLTGDSAPSSLADWNTLISGAQATTYDQLRKFFVNVVMMGRRETGTSFTGGDVNIRLGRIPQATNREYVNSRGDRIGSSVAPVPDPTQVGPLFGRLKGILQQNNATQTANALTQAARWYYTNIERPNMRRTASSSSSASASRPSSSASASRPSASTSASPSMFSSGALTSGVASRQTGWFKNLSTPKKVALIAGGIALLGGLSWFALSPAKPKQLAVA